jgi:hypothetical protein
MIRAFGAGVWKSEGDVHNFPSSVIGFYTELEGVGPTSGIADA